MKLLLIILLFSFTANSQLYYVVKSADAEARVKNISKFFYKLSRPAEMDSTKYLFGYVKHPVNDSIALQIDTSITIPRGNLTQAMVDEWVVQVYQSLPNNIRNQLRNYVANNSVLRLSALVLLDRIKLESKQEMERRGWFNSGTLFNK